MPATNFTPLGITRLAAATISVRSSEVNVSTSPACPLTATP